MRTLLLALPLSLSLAACNSIEDLTGNNPIIDKQGVNLALYHVDLQECESYAADVAIAQKVGSSTVAGAAVGGIFGSIVGNSETAKTGAGIGAVGGATRGLSKGLNERQRVIKRCLIGRGYRVLN